VVDVIQGGAGTSTNMNANEVIANIAPGKAGPRERPLRRPAPQRSRQRLAEHQRRVPHGGAAGLVVRHRRPAGIDGYPCAGVSRPRPPNSATCSRSAAPSCRTPCP
jgi:hypothetical protein